MNWYYVDGGKSVGPIPEEQLVRLIQNAQVTQETLVWHEGMAEWKSCREVGPSPVAAPDSSAPGSMESILGDHKFCAHCGNSFLQDDMMRYENLWVCVNCKPIFLQKLKEGVLVSSSMIYGGFWIRLGAKIIDGIILMIVYMILVMPITVGLGVMTGSSNSNPNPVLVILGALLPMVINLGLNVAFSTFFIGKFGATPGKMACGLKVISPDGAKMNYMRAFLRYLGEIVSSLTMSIGYLIAAWDDEKRTLHDRICNTRVVRSN